jgi:hypothetical protein
MANISFNPSLTTSPLSTFQTQTQGYVQGSFLADPNIRQELESGVIASTVTQPLWGGMALTDNVPSPGTNGYALGSSLILATTDANVTAFSVFNRGYNMIIVPGSNNVPLATAGMSLPYFRLGSGARIAVLCTTGLITALEGNPSNTQVQWDFVNQQLIPYSSGTALNVKVIDLNTNSKVVSYNSGAQTASWTAPGNVAIIQI